MRYKIYYGAKPTFTDADKKRFLPQRLRMQSPDERPPEQTRGHFAEQGLGFSRVEGRVRLFLCAVRHI